MNTRFTAPSVKTLAAMKLDCRPEIIRAIWGAETRAELEIAYPPAAGIDREYYAPLKLRDLKREAINAAAGFHGVETLGICKLSGARVFYCNAGDAYAPTLIFKCRRLSVGCWGDLIERGTIQGDGC